LLTVANIGMGSRVRANCESKWVQESGRFLHGPLWARYKFELLNETFSLAPSDRDKWFVVVPVKQIKRFSMRFGSTRDYIPE